MRVSSRNRFVLGSAFVLLLVAPACLADLMCYVCDDCTKVTKDTPLLACNEDFFNQGGSTEASTVTTTTASTVITTEEVTTTPSTTISTTISSSSVETTQATTTQTSEVTTTEPPVSTTVSEESTTEQTEESTEAPMPTPATVGPPETTTGLPTPPAEDVSQASPASVNASDLAVRQRRAAIDTSVSYHCYTIQQMVNNTMITDRGCSRVDPQQSVCQVLQMQNNDTKLANCDPCSMNACNSANSVQLPIVGSLILASIAALLQRL